jgi:phosphoserine phosphatase RsbU/P
MEARPGAELQEELRRALEGERQRRIDLTIALRQLEEAQQIIEQTSRAAQELEIASRIQTSILPTTFHTPGLEIAARMRPAGEVGGDYYAVQPTEGACWVGIGDVAGHGLTAGLIMMMIQSMAAALVQAAPGTEPSYVLAQLNRVLYENVRNRLGRKEHATLTLLRVDEHGAVRCAGAHQDVIVWRAATRQCECIVVPGTWVGLMPAVQEHTPQASWTLAVGDTMVLYTDGITEAVNDAGEQLGLARVCDAILAADPRRGTAAVVEAVFAAADAHSPWRDDDATVLAVRRTG